VRGKTVRVAIGFSLFLIALGASIAYAVDLGQVGPVDIQTVGQILLTVGVVGLVLGLVLAATSRGAPR
jgi:amino acid permease